MINNREIKISSETFFFLSRLKFVESGKADEIWMCSSQGSSPKKKGYRWRPVVNEISNALCVTPARGNFIKRCNIPTKVGEWRLSLYRSIHKVKSMTDWRKEFRGRRLAAARRHDATVGQSVSRSRYSRFPSRSASRSRETNVPRRGKTRANVRLRETINRKPLPFPDARFFAR